MHRFLRIFYFLLGIFLFNACASQPIIFTRSRLMMGHVPVNISIRTSPAHKLEAIQATEGAYQLAQQVESFISEYQPNSEISCLNRNAGVRPCSISPLTYQLLKTSLRISQLTHSAFDIRFGSLTLEGAKGGITFQESFSKAYLPNSKTRLGVGGIGKGFIVDQMIDYLRSKGFSDVLISGGGDLRAVGGPWEVAIQEPGGLPGNFEQKRKISNLAFATSGLYEQGKHIIDPRTLKKVERLGSVTVEGNNLTEADALATAFLVLGREESQKLIQLFPDFKMIWIAPKTEPSSKEKVPIDR